MLNIINGCHPGVNKWKILIVNISAKHILICFFLKVSYLETLAPGSFTRQSSWTILYEANKSWQTLNTYCYLCKLLVLRGVKSSKQQGRVSFLWILSQCNHVRREVQVCDLDLWALDGSTEILGTDLGTWPCHLLVNIFHGSLSSPGLSPRPALPTGLSGSDSWPSVNLSLSTP